MKTNRKDNMSKRSGPRKICSYPMHIKICKHLLINRVRTDKTQQEMANILDVTFQQYQKWEKGNNRIYAEQLLEICSKSKWNVETFVSDPNAILEIYENGHEDGYQLDQMKPEKIGFIKRKFKVLDDLYNNHLNEREQCM